jgi:Staphylococcal nuclease homologue
VGYRRAGIGATLYRNPCGLDASHALAKQIGRKRLICVRRDTDRYGRMVALCTVEGVDISQWMVTQGQAIAFRKYSLDYIADEDRARAAKAGLWAGEFQDPSDFRHQKRGGQGSPPPEHATPQGQAGARRACACPDDTDSAGHRCGGRSSNLRLGGRTSACVARK